MAKFPSVSLCERGKEQPVSPSSHLLVGLLAPCLQAPLSQKRGTKGGWGDLAPAEAHSGIPLGPHFVKGGWNSGLGLTLARIFHIDKAQLKQLLIGPLTQILRGVLATDNLHKQRHSEVSLVLGAMD